MSTHNAEVLWAQRSSETEAEKNIIFLTINLPNIIGEPELTITEDHITFKAQAGAADKGIPENTYAFSLPLYAPIDPSLTKRSLSSRYLQLILRKTSTELAFWPRLTKDKVRLQWLKTDFAKWVDEDEQEEVAAPDESEFQGMPGGGGPPGGMPGMGGPPGMGGLDMEALMAQMGGGMGGGAGAGGGAPGGGMDFAKLMADMQKNGGGMGGMPDFGAGGDSDDEDEEEDVPELVSEEKEIEKVD